MTLSSQESLQEALDQARAEHALCCEINQELTIAFDRERTRRILAEEECERLRAAAGAGVAKVESFVGDEFKSMLVENRRLRSENDAMRLKGAIVGLDLASGPDRTEVVSVPPLTQLGRDQLIGRIKLLTLRVNRLEHELGSRPNLGDIVITPSDLANLRIHIRNLLEIRERWESEAEDASHAILRIREIVGI